MSEQAPRRRLAAILAADVVGYSRMMQADEAGTLAVLKSRRTEILQPVVSRHRGRIVKLMGDGVLVEFASAVDAVECGVRLQEAMAAANVDLAEDRRIVLRVGINLGDVMVEGSDLYGDGVNIAARLEALAKPGSVFVSGKVRQEVAGKIELNFEDLGEQELKNMAEPVQVYRIAGLEAGAPQVHNSAIAAKPSIVVLPFENISGDPEQEHFADGLTDNILTGLSRFRDIFVVARHSSFAYKGKRVKVLDVCRELNVRYVLEGSVQRSSNRVRIIAQLIDGTTGGHLWVERYDRGVEDAFALQDEVTEKIVATLAATYGGRLRRAWQERDQTPDARNAQATDYFLRGIELMDHFTKDDNQRARELFHKAIQVDPAYGKAYAKLAWTHITEATFGWSEDVARSLAHGRAFATKAVEIDDEEAWGHWALAGYWMYQRQHDRAVSEFQKALALNSNDADVLTDFAWCLSYAGRAAEGLEIAQKAMQLNPHHPDYWVRQLGQIYYDCHRYEEAIATLETLDNLDAMRLRLYQAASHAALGHVDEAHEAIKRALELYPEATLSRWTSPETAPYKNPGDLRHYRENLGKAGLPE